MIPKSGKPVFRKKSCSIKKISNESGSMQFKPTLAFERSLSSGLIPGRTPVRVKERRQPGFWRPLPIHQKRKGT
jgi:hypothetical protein